LPKLKAPFGSDGSLTGTPSISTSVERDELPRRNTLACWPMPPPCTRRSPGTKASASASVTCPRSSICWRVTTVMAAGTRSSAVGARVAVTMVSGTAC
jgi:hypothetical protein